MKPGDCIIHMRAIRALKAMTDRRVTHLHLDYGVARRIVGK